MSFWKIALGVGCGILLATAALVGGCVFLFGYGIVKQDAQRRLEIAAIEIGELEGKTRGDWYTITGTVTNTGDRRVRFVKVECDLEHRSGEIIDTDWTYAVSSEGLAPGASKSFDMSMRHRDKRFLYPVCRLMTE